MLVWSFVQIFFFCELGERITSRFSNLGHEMCQCDWYTLPIDIQKVFPLIIAGMDTPIKLIGMGSIQCSRVAFKYVWQCNNSNVKEDLRN